MATPPESVEIYCLKCRAKTGSRDVETGDNEERTPRPARCLHRVRHRQVPHRLRRMNLGRQSGLRLHLSRVVCQRARLLLREMPGVASPAQGFQRPTGSRVARSHLQETQSRFLSPFPSRRRNPPA